MKTALPFFLLLFPCWVQAQFSYVLDHSVAVEGDKATHAMPWVGGLNAAQYNTMDLNDDGREDLVLFDRMADKVFTFLNDNDHYTYTPAYESFFPDEITNWLLLRDHNCDGRKDIFTGDILGIKVFTNITPDGGTPAWEQFFFYAGGSTKSPVLLTKGFTSKINLQLQFDDLPAIIDADGDGDLDIFSVRFAGNGTVEYHKNLSQERYASCDSLDYERQTLQWGGFTECSCGIFAYNGEDCPPSGGRTQHAGGKSLLAMDANGDNALDMIVSEATCTRLSLLPNEGDLANPVVTRDIDFPDRNPVGFLVYPAAYYEDVDFDGVRDMVSTPNIFTKTILNTNLARSNWFYKNTGTNAAPVFSFVQHALMQDEMIDVGDNSVPAFIDYDGDGDQDLFISNNTSEITSGAVYVYENTGTASVPAFTLLTDNFLNITSLAFYNIKIQFADIDHDNTTDLVFTATRFFDGTTRLYYLPNGTANGLDYALEELQLVDFPMASTENVYLTDITSDGYPDILHGRSNGALYLWRNNGSAGAPTFTLEDDTYLGIGSSVLQQNLACAVGDLDADGGRDLVIGDQTGRLRVIGNFMEATSAEGAATNLVWNPLSETYRDYNLGGRVWPTVTNLFQGGKPSIISGSTLGGLTILRHDEEGAFPENPVINIYPNPLPQNDLLHVVVDRSAYVQILSITGQTLTEPELVQANQVREISTRKLAAGVYILRFFVNGKSFAKRFVVY